MIASIGPQQIDSILDQLESLSQQEQSRRKFCDAVISRLRMLLNADSVSYLVRLGQETWNCVAHSLNETQPSTIQASTNRASLVRLTQERSWVLDADGRSLVVPFDPAVLNQALAVRFDTPIDELACKDLVGLIQAFAELIDERNRRELTHFFQSGFSNLQRSLAGLAKTRQVKEAATVLVNDIASILAADRVSLVECNQSRVKILNVSGRAATILPTETCRAIERVCKQASQSGKPQIQTPGTSPLNQSESESLLLANYVACSLGLANSALHSSNDSRRDHQTPYLLMEWSDTEQFLTGLSLIQYTLPTVAPLWQAHVHQIQRGSWRRWLAINRLFVQSHWIRRLLKLVALVIGIGAAYFGLTYPVEFRLEMEGRLEPTLQRTIYAAHDGYVEHLAVDDNHSVKKGQLLAAMRSPQLDLDIQDVRGELRANQEKHKALLISLNQFGSNSTDAQVKQQTIGSELKQLEIQRATLEARLGALENERQKLSLTSPIDGVVVSREIARMLDSRPIRRGDAVMRVADPHGTWRLALKVKDTDAGHLRQAFLDQQNEESNRQATTDDSDAESKSSVEHLPIDFVIVSQPDKSFKADLTWVSSSARNPDGQGVILDALADIEPEAASQAHIGATVQAYVRCGTRPFCYVWSRPLWEAIQRKLWF